MNYKQKKDVGIVKKKGKMGFLQVRFLYINLLLNKKGILMRDVITRL